MADCLLTDVIMASAKDLDKKERKLVVVFGGARVPEESPGYREAYNLGWQLAKAGYVVATGGYMGTMEAVSRGAAEAKGHVVGYTCSLFDPLAPNPWVMEERKTSSLSQRIQIMAEDADAFIALRGGIGTLAELAVVWNLLLINGVRPKPLILLGAHWRGLLAALQTYTQVGSSVLAMPQIVTTPSEAVAFIARALSS
ncbi:MAG TPA: LOG family protein [Anaerolineae bacterium]|nr:LOG family protein [Anaerolineae bacterium]